VSTSRRSLPQSSRRTTPHTTHLSQPVISSSERALYAALTSDLQTLLPSCSSWEDHLWAHVLSRVEARLEARWRDLGGFWEEESRALGDDEEDAQVRGGLEEVFASMAAVQKEDVA
jgi:nuclear pore complex protein Nup107